MGRVLRRVPLDFDWPLNRTWDGFIKPAELRERPCPDCERGYAPDAERLFDLWYGQVPFDPASNGCTPLTAVTPAVRAFAERNIASAPDYYGDDEAAIVREAERLARLWNGMWSHHLTQVDVDALVDAGRLYDFTHTWVPEHGWQPKHPLVMPTAAAVNEWSLHGWGHDELNAAVVVKARCVRDDLTLLCPTCEGRGAAERYPGQRAESAAWEPTAPPEGDGWQLWQTITEGSPVSPVFAAADALAGWMAANDEASSFAAAQAFIAEGWAPTAGTVGGLHLRGVEYVAATAPENTAESDWPPEWLDIDEHQ